MIIAKKIPCIIKIYHIFIMKESDIEIISQEYDSRNNICNIGTFVYIHLSPVVIPLLLKILMKSLFRL